MGRRGIADQAWLFLMLPGLFWAGNAIVGRAVAGDVPPIALAFWRWAFGAILVLPLAYRHLQRDFAVMLSEWRIMIVFSVTGVAIFNTFLYVAAHTTTALNIVMLQSAGPVMIVLASFLLFHEPIKARQALGIGLSLTGVVTLVSHGDLLALLGLGLNRGDLWMLAAVVSYATYAALLRRRPPVHGLSFLIATFVLGALALLPFYIAESLSGRPLPLAVNSGLSVSYAALFASVLAYFSFNRVVALLGANTAGLAIHLVPVFGTILAILLLGEIPRAYHGIGIAMILSGIWVATRVGSSVHSPSSVNQIPARSAEEMLSR